MLVLLAAAGLVLAGLVAYSLRQVRMMRSSLARPGPDNAPEVDVSASVRRHRRPLRTLVTLTVAESALALLSPWPLQVVVDHAIGHGPLPGYLSPLAGLSRTGIAFVAALFGVVLVGTLAVVGYAATLVSATVSESIGTGLRLGLVRRLIGAPIGFHDESRSGDLVSRLTTDVSRVQDSLLARAEVLLPRLLAVVGMTVLMVLISPVLALVVLALAPALVLLAAVRRRAVTSAQRRSRARSGDLAGHATELVRNVRLVRAFGQEEQATERFGRLSRELAAASLDATAVSARLAPGADLLLALDLAVVLVLGTVQVVAHHLSLGELLVFLAYLASLESPVRSLSDVASTLGRGAVSSERLDEILRQEPSGAAVGTAPMSAERRGRAGAPSGAPAIRATGVRFAYDGSQQVLGGLSFEVASGETVCLLGPSGGGKSTLLSLLVRLHDPLDGRLELDGRDLRSFSLDELHSSVSLVPQDAWLVAGTIEENIAFGAPEATEAAVRAAGRMAHVDEFAERLPAGWSTEVGEGGVRLSGGQRKRVALARALLVDTPVLLLDEPTAGLDAASRRLVSESIAAACSGRTVLLATHDEHLCRLADRVLVLEGGRFGEARGDSPSRLHTTSTVPPPGSVSIDLASLNGERR